MNRRSRVFGIACLAGCALSLILIGLLWVVRRNTLLQTTSASYTPLSGEAEWEGGWELSARGADPSEAGSLVGTDRVTIPFSGTDLALTVRRGDYRANLFVSVDGEPANHLPREERGAYLVLSSPDYEPQVVTISVAGGLSDGPHEAVLIADRGWDQWPLVGWRVSRTPDTTVYDWALVGLGAIAFVPLAGAIWLRGKWQEARGKEQEASGRRQVARGKGQEARPASCILRPACCILSLLSTLLHCSSCWSPAPPSSSPSIATLLCASCAFLSLSRRFST